eukprot:5832887-Pleurochrysis_carterae.AAC.1
MREAERGELQARGISNMWREGLVGLATEAEGESGKVGFSRVRVVSTTVARLGENSASEAFSLACQRQFLIEPDLFFAKLLLSLAS